MCGEVRGTKKQERVNCRATAAVMAIISKSDQRMDGNEDNLESTSTSRIIHNIVLLQSRVNWIISYKQIYVLTWTAVQESDYSNRGDFNAL